MRTEFLCISVLRVTPPPPTSPPPPVVYSTDRSKAVVPVLVLLLLLCGLFYEAICFVPVFFSPFSIAIFSLGEEKPDFNAFSTFARFVLV